MQARRGAHAGLCRQRVFQAPASRLKRFRFFSPSLSVRFIHVRLLHMDYCRGPSYAFGVWNSTPACYALEDSSAPPQL